MKGSWDVFLFNTEKAINVVVLTEKGHKWRMTRDEGRMMRDERRGTRDERRMTRDERRMTRDEWRGTRDEWRGVEVTNNDLEIWRFRDYCYFCSENPENL